MSNSIDPDDKRLMFLPEKDAAIPPPGLIEHLKDRWWYVHPERGLVFWIGVLAPNRKPDIRKAWPQCNSNEAVLQGDNRFPWAQVQFVASVFRPININDWRD
jgi:hypothetical protein